MPKQLLLTSVHALLSNASPPTHTHTPHKLSRTRGAHARLCTLDLVVSQPPKPGTRQGRTTPVNALLTGLTVVHLSVLLDLWRHRVHHDAVTVSVGASHHALSPPQPSVFARHKPVQPAPSGLGEHEPAEELTQPQTPQSVMRSAEPTIPYGSSMGWNST